MSGVASKNLYEILGNDPDSDGEVRAPPKEIVKQKQTTKKKDVAPEPVAAPPQTGRGEYRGRGRGGSYGGNEGAFRDRGAGRENNRARDTDDQEGPRGGHRGRGRGGRRDFDRHSGTGLVDSDKKVAQGWGGATGESGWTDEKAAEQIAQADAAVDNTGASSWDDPSDPPADSAEAQPPAEDAFASPTEPEERQKLYDDYLAERAAAKAALGSLPEARQPNEGSRVDKKWAKATPLSREDEELFSPTSEKVKRTKERKEKQLLEIDQSFHQEFRENRRGGRGRGEGRGGGGRGGPRGDRRGGGRNGPRNQPVDIADPDAFPSLGA